MGRNGRKLVTTISVALKKRCTSIKRSLVAMCWWSSIKLPTISIQLVSGENSFQVFQDKFVSRFELYIPR